MKNMPNIRARLQKLKERSEKLHNLVFEAFKKAVIEKNIDYAAQLRAGFIYSIGCGRYSNGFYSHKLLYMDGEINLYEMSFDRIHCIVASWKTIERFKKEIIDHFN